MPLIQQAGGTDGAAMEGGQRAACFVEYTDGAGKVHDPFSTSDGAQRSSFRYEAGFEGDAAEAAKSAGCPTEVQVLQRACGNAEDILMAHFRGGLADNRLMIALGPIPDQARI